MEGWISREAVLSKYKLQETTLSQLEESALFEIVTPTSMRNRVGYVITPELDLLFRTAKATFNETQKSTRALPMQRALLALTMAEGPAVAAEIMTRRLVYSLTTKDVQTRWKNFVGNLPDESKDYFLNPMTAPVTPAVELVFKMLEMEESQEDPALLQNFNAIFLKPKMRGYLDGLLYHHAKHAGIARCMSDLFMIELTADQIRQYQLYYFDTLDISEDDLAFYVQQFKAISGYYNLISTAVTSEDLFTFISLTKLPMEIEHQQVYRYALRQYQHDIVSVRAGPVSQKRFSEAVTGSVALTTAMQNQQAIDRENAVTASDGRSDVPDLIALRNDMEANQKLLHDLTEIPRGDRDNIAAGPTATVKPTGTDGD